MDEVRCRTSLVPLAFPRFVLCLLRVAREGLLDYQGRAGIMSIVRWNLRPVTFGVNKHNHNHYPLTQTLTTHAPLIKGVWVVPNLLFYSAF